MLCWDVYNCSCGGTAAMGVMSLVAHCDKCPRVYAIVGIHGRGQWFASIEEANQEHAKQMEKR